jgi:hypothetical protein
MAQINQLGGIAVAGGDIPVKNYGGSDIAAGLVVKYDTSNPGGTNLPRGVVITSNDTLAMGVTVTVIPAGKTGLVRTLGQAIGTASATIHVGQVLMSDSAGKVLPQTAAKTQIGIATSEALNGDFVAIDIARAANA